MNFAETRFHRALESRRRTYPAFAQAAAALLAVVVAACGGAPLRVASLDEVERARASEVSQESARSAPDAYARAERERDLARQAHANGDDVAANLHAEHALAAYQHATVVARVVRATAEQSDAQKSLDEAGSQLATVDAERAKLEREADDLDQRARLARERWIPAASASTTAEREAARWMAARSLAAQARLLCAAARLVKPDAEGLVTASEGVSALEERLERPPPIRPTTRAAGFAASTASASPPTSPIDEAARTRAHCLDLLTSARRTQAGGADEADGLLAELSASGGWDPMRDERGVMVALRGTYRGTELLDDANAKLNELGRVASAHPSFAIQVVVHDAAPPARGTPDDTDLKRGEAAVHALIAGGASPSRIHAELAGSRLPIADSNDVRQRQRNERLEIVFVSP